MNTRNTNESKPLGEALTNVAGAIAGRRRMDAWDFVWVLWIVYFLVAEGIALANKEPGDTLSEKVWRFVAHQTFGQFLGAMTVAFLLWLAWHIAVKVKWF